MLRDVTSCETRIQSRQRAFPIQFRVLYYPWWKRSLIKGTLTGLNNYPIALHNSNTCLYVSPNLYFKINFQNSYMYFWTSRIGIWSIKNLMSKIIIYYLVTYFTKPRLSSQLQLSTHVLSSTQNLHVLTATLGVL